MSAPLDPTDNPNSPKLYKPNRLIDGQPAEDYTPKAKPRTIEGKPIETKDRSQRLIDGKPAETYSSKAKPRTIDGKPAETYSSKAKPRDTTNLPPPSVVTQPIAKQHIEAVSTSPSAAHPADTAGPAPVTQSPAGNGPPTQITPSNPTAATGEQEVKFPKFNKLQASIFITKLSIPKLKIYVRKAPDYLRYTKQGNIEEKIIDFFNQPGCQNAKAAFESSPFGASPAMLATHISNAV